MKLRTTNEDMFVCTGYNDGIVIIDMKNRVTIIYAQHTKYKEEQKNDRLFI